MPQREAQARIRINKLLEDAGWRFFPTADGKSSIVCEHRITRRAMGPSANLGDDFERAPEGFVDYLLLNGEAPAPESAQPLVPEIAAEAAA